MGFFNNILGGTDSTASLTKEESFIGILLAAVAADGVITDEEVADFNSFVTKAKTLRGVSGRQFNGMIDKLFKILRRKGVGTLVELSTQNLSSNLRESTFAMACDLLFSDGEIDIDEQKLLEDLKVKLEINDTLATKIAEVMVIKNKA